MSDILSFREACEFLFKNSDEIYSRIISYFDNVNIEEIIKSYKKRKKGH